MKGVIVTEYGDLDVLDYRDIDIPDISNTEVLIHVHATSVNFADIKARKGIYHGTKEPPFIPGIDLMGIIEEIGSEVKNLYKGQRVIAFPNGGSYSEYAKADQLLTFPIPDELDSEIAAACPTVSFTSYNLLVEVARIEKGESVLIHSAAGGVGTTVTQLAKILGAKRVIGTVSSDEKKLIAQQAGADYVINYQKEDLVERILDLTEGKGVHIVLDSLGGDVFEKSLKSLSRFGRIVNFGNSSGIPGKTVTTDLHSSCRSVLGYSFGTTRKFRPDKVSKTANSVLPYLIKGELSMHISNRFKLSCVRSAQEYIESRKSTGKVLLIP